MRLWLIALLVGCSGDDLTTCDMRQSTVCRAAEDVAREACNRRTCDPAYALAFDECFAIEIDRLCTSKDCSPGTTSLQQDLDRLRTCLEDYSAGPCDAHAPTPDCKF